MGTSYWPAEVPRSTTLATFQQAYALLGYEVCASPDFEAGFEKIAVYADTAGIPKHAARLAADGSWTSKLGTLEDIIHGNLESLSGKDYGAPVLFLRRPRS